MVKCVLYIAASFLIRGKSTGNAGLIVCLFVEVAVVTVVFILENRLSVEVSKGLTRAN